MVRWHLSRLHQLFGLQQHGNILPPRFNSMVPLIAFYQKITGPTDGGIVIFGSPGSTITGNTIESSATERGFGAINMVDGQYHGSYANVVVSNNKIIGQKLFNLGIGIGSSIWSDYNPSPLHGPATIKNNVFSGNIVFAIAINGWDNGITVSHHL